MRFYLRRRWLFLSFWLKPAGRENEGLRKIGNRCSRLSSQTSHTARIFAHGLLGHVTLSRVFDGREDKAAVCFSFFGFCTNSFEMSIEIWYFEVRSRDPTRLRGSRGCLATLCWYRVRGNWERGGYPEPRSRTKQRIREMERKIRAVLRNGAGSKETLKLRWTIRSY